MLRAARAWRLRQQARISIESGDSDAALRLASQAQEMRWTWSGESLRLLSAWRNTLQ
jgi:hypothetical protein